MATKVSPNKILFSIQENEDPLYEVAFKVRNLIQEFHQDNTTTRHDVRFLFYYNIENGRIYQKDELGNFLLLETTENEKQKIVSDKLTLKEHPESANYPGEMKVCKPDQKKMNTFLAILNSIFRISEVELNIICPKVNGEEKIPVIVTYNNTQ